MNIKLSRLLIHLNRLSGHISNLYNSDLSFRKKNDLACRLITDIFDDIACTSILLYNSKTDVLENAGHYLSPVKANADFSKCTANIRDIVYNKTIYDYLSYKKHINELGKLSYNDFRQFCFIVPKNIFIDGALKPFTQFTFDTLLKRTLSDKDQTALKQHYLEYIINFHKNDIHKLTDEESRSATFYKKNNPTTV